MSNLTQLQQAQQYQLNSQVYCHASLAIAKRMYEVRPAKTTPDWDAYIAAHEEVLVAAEEHADNYVYATQLVKRFQHQA